MRALIAGATGFVGRALAPELLEDGMEVRCCPYDSNYRPKPLREAIAASLAAA